MATEHTFKDGTRLTRLIRLESLAIQLERGARGSNEFEGFVLYFETTADADKAWWRIYSADSQWNYALAIFQGDEQRSQREERLPDLLP